MRPFMDEVAGNPQLGQFERGDRAIIGVFPGTSLMTHIAETLRTSVL